ncbi:MAG: response regulator [Natronomonas sp.]
MGDRMADERETVRVLHVDDEPGFAETTARFLEREDERFVVETAATASDGCDRLREADFDCIVSDYDMPGGDGIEFLNDVRETDPDIPFVLFTGKGSEEIASEAISAGVSDYLQKGSGTDQYSLLANRIDNLVSGHRAESRLETHAEQQRRVADLSRDALAGTPLETLFDRAVEIVADTLGHDYAEILEHRPDHGDLRFRSGVGWRDEGETTVETDGDSGVKRILNSPDPIVVENRRTDDRLGDAPRLDAHDIVGSICVTIGSAEDPLGVLCTHTTEATTVTDDDVTFVRGVANVLANAIERADREAELTQSETRYRRVAENFPNGVVALFDDDLRYEVVHGNFENMDLTPETMEGKRVQDVFSAAVAERLVPRYRAALNGEPSAFEMTFQERLYRVHVVPIETGVQGMVMSQDITGETEDKRQLETFLENFPGYIYRHRYESGWPLEFVKGAAETVTGYTADELEDDVTLAEEIIHPEDRDYVQDGVAEGLEAEGQYTLTYRIFTKGGEKRWVWERGILVEDPVTGEEKLEGFIIDFTEHKKRQQELEETNAILSTLFETLPVGVLAEDASRNVLVANDRLFELFGMADTSQEWTGADCEQLLEAVGDSFDGEFVARTNEIAAGQEPVDDETLSLDDGRTFERSHRPLELPDGDGGLWVYRDVTARTEQSRERVATIEFLQSLYDVATDRESTADEKITRLLEIGPRKLDLPYGHLTRIERAGDGADGTQTIIEASGDHDLLQPGDSCPLARSYCRKTIKRNDVLKVQNAAAEGWDGDPAYETFGLECYIGTPITVDGDLYGTVFFASGTPRDSPFSDAEETFVRLMSQLVSYELEHERTTAELKQQNERLEEFVSVVSHDLRSPLTVADGRLELARMDCDSEHLDAVKKAHGRMKTLVDDLLTLAREGETATDPRPVGLGDLAESCWLNVDTADGTLVVDTDRTITADRSRLAQLLENLIRNAVEHGGEGVTVTVGELDDGFYVADDGPGIPPEDREQIFDFGYSTSEEGTGFGLAIVDEIADAHDWAIDVTESDTGGTRFEITGVEIA